MFRAVTSHASFFADSLGNASFEVLQSDEELVIHLAISASRQHRSRPSESRHLAPVLCFSEETRHNKYLLEEQHAAASNTDTHTIYHRLQVQLMRALPIRVSLIGLPNLPITAREGNTAHLRPADRDSLRSIFILPELHPFSLLTVASSPLAITQAFIDCTGRIYITTANMSSPPVAPPPEIAARSAYSSPAWFYYKQVAPRPAYTPPPPAPLFAAENVHHTAEGTRIETYRWDDAAALLQDLPISSTTLRVKVLRDSQGYCSAKLYGYSRERDFGPALQRMVEANQRQHGQKTLGAPLSESSIARIVDEFSKLDSTGDGEQSASAWGRVELAVIACLDVNDTSQLEAVMTTKTNLEVVIKVTGFEVPTMDSGTPFFAELIVEEIPYVLPSDRRLAKDELEYYCKKATAMNKLPIRFAQPNLLHVFATAADFPAEVTNVALLKRTSQRQGSVMAHEPIEDDDFLVGAGSRYYGNGNHVSGRHGGPFPHSLAASGSLSDNPDGSRRSDTVPEADRTSSTLPQAETSMVAKHLTANVVARKEELVRFGRTNLSRFDQSQKRTLTDAQLGHDAPTSANKRHRSSFFAGRSTDTSTPPHHNVQTQPPSTPSPDHSSSSSDLPTAITKPKAVRKPKVSKPIPTRTEMHTSWTEDKMTQYTVPQLRGYLRQEDRIEDLNNTSTRDALLRRVREMEEVGRVYPGER